MSELESVILLIVVILEVLVKGASIIPSFFPLASIV
nr:MAG TPA: hypothetical protein [Caudoviricetes sp.]